MNRSRVPLNVTYDADVDAAYIYFYEQSREVHYRVADTIPVDPLSSLGMVNLDVDDEGRLLGIEVLAASEHLPRELLAAVHAATDDRPA